MPNPNPCPYLNLHPFHPSNSRLKMWGPAKISSLQKNTLVKFHSCFCTNVVWEPPPQPPIKGKAMFHQEEICDVTWGNQFLVHTLPLCEEASTVRASRYCHLFSIFRFLFVFRRRSVDTVSISRRLMCCVMITLTSEASEVLGLTSFPWYMFFLSLPSIFTDPLEPFPLFVKLL